MGPTALHLAVSQCLGPQSSGPANRRVGRVALERSRRLFRPTLSDCTGYLTRDSDQYSIYLFLSQQFIGDIFIGSLCSFPPLKSAGAQHAEGENT